MGGMSGHDVCVVANGAYLGHAGAGPVTNRTYSLLLTEHTDVLELRDR